MKKKDRFFEFPAVKGIQANKPYYIAMCPLYLIKTFLTYTDNSLPPAMREQRILNWKRVPEIKEYILKNRDCYVFSALTASVDGELEFIAPKNGLSGKLKISMDSRIILNDGQHRKAAIELALNECPELRYEDISIVFYYDQGLTHSQQMFTDLNRHAVRPTKSLNILFDNRDKLSIMVKQCISDVSVFCDNVENEKSSLSNRSRALFTLSGIFNATKLLLQGCQLDDDEIIDTITTFWNSVAVNMLVWQKVKCKLISPVDFRKDYVCAHAIALKALGCIGNELLRSNVDKKKWKDRLSFLQNINWHKASDELQGIVVIKGRICSSHNNERAFVDYLIKKSDLIRKN